MLQLLRKAAARLRTRPEPEAEAMDLHEFLATLFAAPSVTSVLSALKFDSGSIVQHLRTGPIDGDAQSQPLQAIVEGAQRRHQDLAQIAGAARPSLDLLILVSVCIQGPAWFRDLLSRGGRRAGEIPFFVAHGKREEDLMQLWPDTGGANWPRHAHQ